MQILPNDQDVRVVIDPKKLSATMMMKPGLSKILLKAAIAEFIGLFMIVFLGCGAVITSKGENILLTSISFGLVVAFTGFLFDDISGAHYNPAVTLAFILLRETNPWHGLVYVFAQILASTSASALHLLVYPAQMLVETDYCATTVNSTIYEIDMIKAIVLETIMTFTLIFVILRVSTSDIKEKRVLTPFLAGSVVALNVYFGAPLTGASLNPARSIGPAIVGTQWNDHYVYWIGPLAGSLFATITFKFLFPPSSDRSFGDI